MGVVLGNRVPRQVKVHTPLARIILEEGWVFALLQF